MRQRIATKKIIQVAFVVFLLAGSFVLVSATKPVWTAQDKAFYADPNLLAFVRPGLDIKILSAEIAADGTIRARLKFTDPRGMPLDREGILTPGPISAGLIAAVIPRRQREYVAYTTRIQRSPITGQSAVQAAADSGGRWEKVADGEYIYTFGTKAPSDIDRSATHTIGVYANRNLTEFDLGINLKEVTYNFVPDGSPVQQVRDVIRTETCNKCHQSLSAHGTTGRTTVAGCVLCHTPQTVDPDTGNTVDFKVMIHKIHRGKDLPSVRAGGKYQIIGFGQNVFDYSNITFPAAPFGGDTSRQCETCHESNRGATQADAWLTHPNRAACGSCHDNVNFATGENHANLPQVSDNQCANCHTPEGELEFDVSIKGAHTTAMFSKELPGVVFEILEIRDGVAGKAPTVTFTLKDKKGNPLSPSSFNSLSLIMGGPTSDYSTYITQSALNATGSGDRWTVTFARPIPADAKGTWAMGIEGRRSVTLLPGTQKQQTVNDAGENVVVYFSVDGSPVQPRRKVVELANCNQCHNYLTIHGTLRNQIEYCVICHNPTMTDAARRPADKKPDEAIDFRAMTHRIHSGAELSREFTVYGFGNVPHNYNEVHYPGFLQNCAACHVPGTQRLPLGQNLLQVTDPRGYLNPVGPETIACISCHDSLQAASHALANTSALGESCAACHGPNKDFSVDKVHAR
jgi:OmcA/MtrC family decaheme c-type cytochrome